jgi:flagellar protein FliL
MANAVAPLDAPSGTIPDKRRGRAVPNGMTTPQFFGALAIMTVLAVVTGFALAYTVQERITAAQASAEAAPAIDPVRFAGEIVLERLAPVVTNLQEPSDAWVRVDLALVMDVLEEEERKRLASEVGADTLAFLRTLTLSQIEGASGLQFLREDLSERARTRSQGRVRELILETLVVQ